jgi:hypothetical protein
MAAEGLSATSQADYLRAAKGWVRWLAGEEIYGLSPRAAELICSWVPPPKDQSVPLADEEIAAMEEAEAGEDAAEVAEDLVDVARRSSRICKRLDCLGEARVRSATRPWRHTGVLASPSLRAMRSPLPRRCREGRVADHRSSVTRLCALRPGDRVATVPRLCLSLLFLLAYVDSNYRDGSAREASRPFHCPHCSASGPHAHRSVDRRFSPRPHAMLVCSGVSASRDSGEG